MRRWVGKGDWPNSRGCRLGLGGGGWKHSWKGSSRTMQRDKTNLDVLENVASHVLYCAPIIVHISSTSLAEPEYKVWGQQQPSHPREHQQQATPTHSPAKSRCPAANQPRNLAHLNEKCRSRTASLLSETMRSQCMWVARMRSKARSTTLLDPSIDFSFRKLRLKLEVVENGVYRSILLSIPFSL